MTSGDELSGVCNMGDGQHCNVWHFTQMFYKISRAWKVRLIAGSITISIGLLFLSLALFLAPIALHFLAQLLRPVIASAPQSIKHLFYTTAARISFQSEDFPSTSYDAHFARFGPQSNLATGPLCKASMANACQPIENEVFAGCIALIQRSSKCIQEEQVINLENSGAVAVIIGDNTGPFMGVAPDNIFNLWSNGKNYANVSRPFYSVSMSTYDDLNRFSNQSAPISIAAVPGGILEEITLWHFLFFINDTIIISTAIWGCYSAYRKRRTTDMQKTKSTDQEAEILLQDL